MESSNGSFSVVFCARRRRLRTKDSATMSFETVWSPSLYRLREGLGVWKHRGKVAAVGVGHSPTMRRWDWEPESSVGAWSLLALRRAIDDAGLSPDQIDGLVVVPETASVSAWPAAREIPSAMLERFKPTDEPLDGLTKLSPQWILQNAPELSGSSS